MVVTGVNDAHMGVQMLMLPEIFCRYKVKKAVRLFRFLASLGALLGTSESCTVLDSRKAGKASRAFISVCKFTTWSAVSLNPFSFSLNGWKRKKAGH
jgi:hypothetical protein